MNTSTVNASDVKQAIIINNKEYASVEDAIKAAKKKRGSGDMVGCLKIVMWLIYSISPVTGEMVRLAANALVDLDLPNTAEHLLSQFDVYTELDEFKNLDVLARIQYKKGMYEDAIKLIRQKMELTPKFAEPGDEKREYPTLLWFYTIAGNKAQAFRTLLEMTAGRNLEELSIYELKAWAFYNWHLKEHVEDSVRQRMIEHVLNMYFKDYADNGPISFTLFFLGYEDTNEIIEKFKDHLYLFESSIINGLVPSEFYHMRGEALELLKNCDKGTLVLDAIRPAWYTENIEERVKNGTLPL